LLPLEPAGHEGELEPLAVIDIGSNSVRLVVYDGLVRSPTPIFNEKVLCGLGRALASTGKLGQEGITRALAALARFRAVCRILHVKNVNTVATAAVRDAADGADFIKHCEFVLGSRVQTLSGDEEARYAAYGILMGFNEPDGLAGDLGGGSLELIDLQGSSLRQSVTLPLGGLRLIDVSGGSLDRAVDLADARIDAIPWIKAGEGRSFHAVGGTWRALARLHMDETDYPLRVMHGYVLPAKVIADFSERVRKAKRLSDFKGIGWVTRQRREVLPFGALVMERLLKRMKPKEVVFSVYGIREGLLFGLLPDSERRRDPLLSFCEDFARQRSRSLEHARELGAWTDALFQQPGPGETADERRLRHAACLISDIGWRAHPDYRGAQSLNLVAHAGLGGIDHAGRVFMALTVYFRHVGPTSDDIDHDELSARLKTIVSKRLLRRARILGAAIRTAHMLSIGMPGIIDETELAYEDNKIVMKIPRAYASLEGERLSRRFDQLAALLDRKGEIRISR
jgi:exopolyphosphatase/guanosine-5'-triphosphate,3'-diphosphate pyrophosphatase